MRRFHGAKTMRTIPNIPQFTSKGTFFIAEYELTDGCDKKRKLPKAIITVPERNRSTSQVCDYVPRVFTEWSVSLQVFDSSGPFVTSISHTISVRITSNPDVSINSILDDLNYLLEACRSTGQLGLGNSTLDARFLV